jgi:hypothetical protein
MQRYAKSSYGVILSAEEVQILYRGWQNKWPVVSRNYLGWISEITRSGFANIEHFYTGRKRGNCSYCVAANSYFQGLAADGMKAALWEVTKKCYMPGTPLYGCRVVNQIHDELLLEAPIDKANDAAWELRDTMVEAYNKFVPDVPVKATPALMDRWSKAAESIIKDGVLKVWRYVK